MNRCSVKEATFLVSATSLKNTPPPMVTEVVFVGRSNVGKSSLLNSLTNRKSLAKSSSTPGKTRLINFFDLKVAMNEQDYTLRFVDLPGFGYAKVSKSMKEEWEKSLTDFLLQRDSIRLFIQLIDARHENLQNDLEVTAFLNSIKRDDQMIFTVFTKVDKLKQNDQAKLRNANPEAFFVSNLKKRGIDELRNAICGYLFQ
jgi:GTP-binding protein